MSQMTCPVCSHPTKDGLACRTCTTAVLKDITDLPGWMDEIDLQLTRQGQLGTGNGGRGAETPLVFDVRSSETRDLIVNTVTTWVRDMQESYGDTDDPGMDMATWCAWLAQRIERIRGHIAVRHLADEMRHCVILAIQSVDLPQVRLSCGPCPTCGKPVSASVGAEEGVCRHCAWAGVESVVKVDHSLPTVLNRAREALVSRKQLLDAAKLYQVEIDRRALSRWVRTGRLQAMSVTEEGVPQYRLGDVLELAGSMGEVA